MGDQAGGTLQNYNSELVGCIEEVSLLLLLLLAG
jgi:hypothetical protein